MTTLRPAATRSVQRAEDLGPLLAAIGRELRERTTALQRLLVEREQPAGGRRPLPVLEAECAAHRCELRHAHQELARLDCRLVCLQPTVFSVGVGAGTERALFWCAE